MPSAIAADFQARTGEANYSDNTRTGLEADAIALALIDNLHCLQARRPQDATRHDWYIALAYTVRDRMMHRYIGTVESISQTNTNAVAYLSAEFLTGPQLGPSRRRCRESDRTCRTF